VREHSSRPTGGIIAAFVHIVVEIAPNIHSVIIGLSLIDGNVLRS
jgi:hypothetical protein